MPTIIRRNERSWAISMISDINIKLQSLNLRIVRAGGETTISTGYQSMFPEHSKRCGDYNLYTQHHIEQLIAVIQK